MLLGYFGSFPRLTDVKEACDCGNNEISPQHLLTVAQRFGFDAQLKEIPFSHLNECNFPSIITTTSGKFILLVKVSLNSFIVHDPELGRQKFTAATLQSNYQGQVLTAIPCKDFVLTKNDTSVLKELTKRLANNKKEIWYVVIAGLILLIPALVIPALSKVFFDDIIIQGQSFWFKPMLMIMGAFLLLGCILVFIQQVVLLQSELKMSLTESAKFVTHILKVPYTYFQNHAAGDTVKRIKLNDAIAIMLSRDLTKMIVSLLTVLFYGIVMVKYSWILTVVGVSVMLVNIFALRYFSAKRTALNQSLFQKQQATFSTATVGIEQIETLKASGAENDFFTSWSGSLVASINDGQKLGITSRLLTVLPDLLSQFNNVVIVFLGGLLIIYGEITIGVFIAMQSFIANFSDPVKDVVNITGNIQLNKSNLNNIIDTLEEPVDTLCQTAGRDPIETINPFNAKLTGKLEVKNITFGYSKFSNPLIKDFSLSTYPGKRVAIVGGSGSGKSTLLKIIAGLYTPISGDILYDDKPIQAINTDVLRSSLSIVDQDVFLFTGTISDNITMWNRAIDNESVVEAAKDAVVHEIISEREGGYQARIAPGGGNFSGGQRQRIEIARALVTSPSIIFLDEATSALDAETEKRIIENLHKRNCTTITIAHRLSTIRNSDEIIVLEKGNVIQRGTHDELMQEKDKLYFRLVSES
jgi:NHLM bacteriocin system ABC transporter peptidase/ATP-binding protein